MTEEAGTGSSPRLLTDEVLCPCDDVSYEAFRNAVWAQPAASFDDLCRAASVGQKCTSCLLNAETTFAEAAAARPEVTGAGPRRRQRRFRLSKQAVYAVIDRLSPKIPFARTSIVPLIAGRGARTLVSLSNAVAAEIGARSPTFRVHAELRDAEGVLLGVEETDVPAGERFDLDASANLPGADGEAFVTGSCRLGFAPRARGYFGTVRPHFAVITPAAMAAVHGQGRGKTDTFHGTVLCNDAESQFVSAVNCSAQPGRVCVKCFSDDQLVGEVKTALPGYGARLIVVTDTSAADVPSRPVTVQASSDVETRFHFMVSCGEPPRISLDHI